MGETCKFRPPRHGPVKEYSGYPSGIHQARCDSGNGKGGQQFVTCIFSASPPFLVPYHIWLATPQNVRSWGRFQTPVFLWGETSPQHHQLTFSMAHHPTLVLSKMHKRRWTPQKTIQNTTNLQCAILGTKNLRWVGGGSKHQQLFFKKDLLWHTTEHHCQNCFLKKNILPQTWHLQNVTYIWEGFTFQM